MGLGKTIDPAIKAKFEMNSIVADGIEALAAVSESPADYKKDQLQAAAELAYILAAFEDHHPHGRRMLLANSKLLMKIGGIKELKIEKPVPLDKIKQLVEKLQK